MAWTSVFVMQNIAEKSCRKRPLIIIIGSDFRSLGGG